MTPEDREPFIEIVLAFAELKSKQLSARTLELYWRLMQHWSLEDFTAAAEHLARTCEFFPGPDAFEKLRLASRPTAGEAWALAVKHSGSAIQCGHVTQNGTCGDPLTDAAVRAIGGYGEIAMCELGKLGFLERRFAEHYESILDAQTTREAVPQIATAERRRLDGPKPIAALIGRERRA